MRRGAAAENRKIDCATPRRDSKILKFDRLIKVTMVNPNLIKFQLICIVKVVVFDDVVVWVRLRRAVVQRFFLLLLCVRCERVVVWGWTGLVCLFLGEGRSGEWWCMVLSWCEEGRGNEGVQKSQELLSLCLGNEEGSLVNNI